MVTKPAEEAARAGGQSLPEVTIVMPVHNEAPSIERVLRSYDLEIASKIGTEIFVCEDGSTDGTREILTRLAQELPLSILAEEARLGYAGSVKKALRLAQGDLIFFSDSDGQYDPKDFWTLAKAMNHSDMAIGRKVKREEPWHRIALSRGFHLIARILFGNQLHDIDCGFRIVRKKVIDEVLGLVRDLPYSFWAEFTIIATLQGFKVLEIPVSHQARLHGTTTIYRPRYLPKIVLSQLRGLIKLGGRFGQHSQ